MPIAAKNSNGVFSECPQCHRAITHGFQVCQHCGYVVSAEQQQALRNRLKVNVARFALLAFMVVSAVLVIAYAVSR